MANPVTTPTRRRRQGTPRQLMDLRHQWAKIIALTPVECRRCGEPITATQKWDLGHPQEFPYSAGNYDQGLAPEHRRCNRGGITTKLPPTFEW